MSNGAQVLSRIDGDLNNNNPRMSSETRGQFIGLWKNARALAASTAEKEKAIRESARWNRFEKHEKLGELLPSVHSLQAGIEADKARVDGRLDRLKATLGTVPPKYNDPVTRQLRGAEIRQVLRAMPEAERVPRFMAAAASGNTDLLDAVLQSPEPLIAEEITTRGVQAWAEKALPEASAEFAQVHELSEQLGSLLVQVQAWANDLEH